MTKLSELADRVSALEGNERYDFTDNPHWAQEGGEHYDGGWTPDCGQKEDFDPGLMRLSSRVWGDGSWCCSVYFGADTQIESTPIMQAENKTHAKAAVEQWCAEAFERWSKVIAASLRARDGGEG